MLGGELGNAADFGDVAVVEDDDEVGHPEGGEAMGHEDRYRTGGLAELGGGTAFDEAVFGVGIEGCGGFVERQQ